LHYKNDLVAALLKETEEREDYLENDPVETIYFGGGTPSLCTKEEIQSILDAIHTSFTVVKDAEVTLEANPDDITEEKLLAWKASGINRLSIGIQSFFEEDLVWMNRAHRAQQARDCLRMAFTHFTNITIDLIYGTPGLTNEKWQQNVETAISLNIPHLSCYALTVEPKTPLDKLIRQEKREAINPDQQSEQFLLLMQWLGEAGYEHYEISNFAKAGRRSRHNSAYWSIVPGGSAVLPGQGKKYLGLGPSAHSFNGLSRQWNIANNKSYINAVNEGKPYFEIEELTATQQMNEYIMTSLRTSEGLNIAIAGTAMLTKSKKFLDSGLMKSENNFLILTREGKLLADGIAAALFV
jgi:oxygen-independent coproporphyrinogen-3 oxidase